MTKNALVVERKLFSGIQVPSTDLYISVVRKSGKQSFHFGDTCKA